MPAITPEFIFELESNMQVISSNEYQRLASNLWYQKIAKTMQSGSKKERISWLLETAMIERPNAKNGGGQQIFEDIVSQTTEFESENAVAGLKLKKEQLEDLDGNGIDLATQWSAQMGAYMAYFPQKQIANAIKSNPVGYDGRPFFDAAHPVNPFNSSAGTYSNLLTGVPLDETNAVDAAKALKNLSAATAHVAGNIKMPNGEDPRMLRVVGILHPASLTGRVSQITDAKFIAQAAGSGGGSSDVEGMIRRMGLGQPIEAVELGAAYGGSDTDYYLVVENITSNPLGAFVYGNREPFSIIYHGEMTDAQLARTREFQWTTEGRNFVGAGHPYLLIKCTA